MLTDNLTVRGSVVTEKTINSQSLLEMVNGARKTCGEPAVRNNKFIEKVIDELDGETYTKSVGRKNGADIDVITMSIKQALRVAARESKAVRRSLVDKLEAMSQPEFDPMAALNDAAFLRGTLLSYSEKVIALEHRVEEMKPDVEALDRIAKAHGSMCITDTAKHLQIQPKSLFKMLSENHWIYRRPGGKAWLAYQDRIQAGVLEHKVIVIERPDGSEKIIEQVLVTAKGLARLSKILGMKVVVA
ncbi:MULTISPECIES: phage antirepressor KilAC domain-containing protein [Pantoea]|uniref:phage antirepressor KilAC domain-containing protein n=1 Tax=Pantoea TaxID=53335 RepID=UPI0010A8A292|nr:MULTISPECIES: phage antirepressor KilAC domain-containing protein [Pantoea]THD40267.1 DNA-binding protein [Pantoea sp. R102]UKY37709.1 phage antirepressor KilAC domain-containing protein [Pantoea dispersa]